MKVLFCRNTHDENGDLHWWLKGKEIKTRGSGVHALSKEGVSFEQYIQYHAQYVEELGLDYHYCPTYIELLEDLIKMIKVGVCFIKEEK